MKKHQHQILNSRKIYLIITAVILFIITAALSVYCLLLDTYAPGTIINGKNAGNLTEQGLAKITYSWKPNALKIKVGDKTEDLYNIPINTNQCRIHQAKEDMILSYIPILNRKYKIGVKRKIDIKSYSKDLLSEYIRDSVQKYNKKPVNARIVPKSLKVTEEKHGTNIDYDDFGKKIISSLENDPECTAFVLDLFEYETKPTVTRKKLREKAAYMRKHIKGGFTVTFDNVQTLISQESLYYMVEENDDGFEINRKKLEKHISNHIKTIRPNRLTVKTEDGNKTLPNYGISFTVNPKKTANNVLTAIEEGKHICKGSYRKPSDMKTRIEVHLGLQTVIYLKDGKTCFISPCVTGTMGHRTPIGIFRISYKATNVTLEGRNDDGSKYESPVTYWMPFNGGIGLHDANWRSAFGGTIYLHNGSHGCVNLPPMKAATLYSAVSAGTLVYVY